MKSTFISILLTENKIEGISEKNMLNEVFKNQHTHYITAIQILILLDCFPLLNSSYNGQHSCVHLQPRTQEEKQVDLWAWGQPGGGTILRPYFKNKQKNLNYQKAKSSFY